MKCNWKGHKDRNRHKNRIKRSDQARLVYVKHKPFHPHQVNVSSRGQIGEKWYVQIEVTDLWHARKVWRIQKQITTDQRWRFHKEMTTDYRWRTVNTGHSDCYCTVKVTFNRSIINIRPKASLANKQTNERTVTRRAHKSSVLNENIICIV